MCFLSLWLCLIGITGIALLPVQATLPPKELEAVRDLFLAAHGFPWNETEDPCTLWNQIHCEKNHVTELKLSDHYQLTSVPESIGNLQLLSVLDLSYNRLTLLPESIGKLQALSEMDVSHTQLTSLPESIGNLQALSKLNVYENQLTSLPGAIGKLQALAELNVLINQLTSLPESIGKLQALSKLDVSYNQLTSVPESIGKLQLLSVLHVSHNRLTSLPESIGKLQALSKLDVSHNQQTSLPESIGKLQALAELNVLSNQLTSLPESIGKLQALSELDVSHNQLTSLPESIGKLQALSKLDVSYNQLMSLPVVGKLQALSELDVAYNQLKSLPESIGKLQALSKLDVSYNQLTSLPESIGDLQALARFYVSHNQLTSLSESIGKLQALSKLDVSYNQLTSLPESVGDLQALSWLYVSSNQLKSLTESIGKLQALSELDVPYNKLTSLPELIGDLQALARFYVSHNQLTSLSESIGKLQALAELNVLSNQLTSLPESIGKLQALSKLDVSYNQLTSLPESVGDLQALSWLYVSSNQLKSLPESIGNLQRLSKLDVSYNQLTSLPHLKLGKLMDLRASGNRLKLLPESLGNLEVLETLALGHNFLERLPENLMRLSSLCSVFVDSNQLVDPAEMCKFERSMLRVLYAHNNRLQGEIPACLTRYTAMQTLTLHSNSLNGIIPRALSRLPELKLLTVHENRLSGFLPKDFAKAPSLTLFSAHSNYLKGRIPPFNLSKDCVDDESFSDQDGHLCFQLFRSCDRADVGRHCPSSCGLCRQASARGPVLLLHNNRLSCDLPEHVTKWAKDIRSISLVGNMLGNGSMGLPTWLHADEQQEFLYLSSNKIMDMFWKTMPYLIFQLVCTVVFIHISRPEFGKILHAEAGTRLLHRSHLFVWRLCIALSLMAAVLLMFYLSHSTYYECKSGFSSTTLSNLFEPGNGGSMFVEWVIVLMWIMWVAVSAIFVEKAYPCSDREAEDTALSHMTDPEPANWHGKCVQYVLKILCSLLWVCIVIILSLPSIAFAVVNIIPSTNTLSLSSFWRKFLHYQAALVMVLTDMFITPKLATFFHATTGIRRSLLLMAARLGTMWLVAVLTTLYLNPHCMNGWTLFWQVCDEKSEHYDMWNMSIGDYSILEPKRDLCQAPASWMSDSACVRSVVDTMAPLLLSKMITRVLLQPGITLAKWLLSEKVCEADTGDTKLFLRWRICNRRICSSKSLEHGQQASLLATFAEMALLWGAFVPLLVPAVLLATGSNMVMCKIGHAHYEVSPMNLDKDATGIARRYLYGTICILLFFQNWFAWSSEMHGRWLLLGTAVLYLLYLALIIGSRNRYSDDVSIELTGNSH